LLVTVWHVLVDVDAGEVGGAVRVEGPPAGGERPAAAEVLRVDPVHDLAVLRRAAPLAASDLGLAVSDWFRAPEFHPRRHAVGPATSHMLGGVR
jgi:hypothetical protein